MFTSVNMEACIYIYIPFSPQGNFLLLDLTCLMCVKEVRFLNPGFIIEEWFFYRRIFFLFPKISNVICLVIIGRNDYTNIFVLSIDLAHLSMFINLSIYLSMYFFVLFCFKRLLFLFFSSYFSFFPSLFSLAFISRYILTRCLGDCASK